MHLITLNIWGGHIKSALLDFFQNYRHIDIFCLQEVYHHATDKISTDDNTVSLNIFSEIQRILPDHQGFFSPIVNETYGIGIFIKKSVDVIKSGDFFIYENENYPGLGPAHSRKMQWIQCVLNGSEYFIGNIHGLWNGLGKNDSPQRISQSKLIREFTNNMPGSKILCGDFNLRPDTESISIIETELQNLITRYQINSTRTVLYPKQEKFADYIFTTRDMMIHHFTVLDDIVSDHAPLLLSCSPTNNLELVDDHQMPDIKQFAL